MRKSGCWVAPARPDFHHLVYALHEQQLAARTVRTEETSGAYNGMAAAGYRYREIRYYDEKMGRLLSRIQRDTDVPDAIHISEVNIYDASGQLTRDYLSIAPLGNRSIRQTRISTCIITTESCIAFANLNLMDR